MGLVLYLWGSIKRLLNWNWLPEACLGSTHKRIKTNKDDTQTWGHIQKYLYLKVFKYFFSSICICIWAFQNEKYLYLYLNTFKKYLIFQIQFKYISNTFVIFFNHILSSPAILLLRPIFYGLILLVNWDPPYGVEKLLCNIQGPASQGITSLAVGTQGWISVWWMKMSLLVIL